MRSENRLQQTGELFRDEDKQEGMEPTTERPETRVRESDDANGRNTANLALEEKEEEAEEEEKEEDIVTRADLARIVSSHFQTIFRQLSDIDQRLNHIENQWKEKQTKLQ